MFRLPGVALVSLLCSSLLSTAEAYRVSIADTDSLREVCSGMYGGNDAYIEVAFDSTSAGQVALVIYEWNDVEYLGVQSGDEETRTYICTTSAVRSSLCTSSQLGSFITSVPSDASTSVFTSPLKFSSDYTASPTTGEDASENEVLPIENEDTTTDEGAEETGSVSEDNGETETSGEEQEDESEEEEEEAEGEAMTEGEYMSARRQKKRIFRKTAMLSRDEDSTSSLDVPTYSAPITYAVPKNGYYCVGIVPVTLVTSRRDLELRAATHAEYSGLVLFKNSFEGELPASEYPKINFYMTLSVLYFVLGCGWAYLCSKHLQELLPMQYYISGTIVFLVIEMLAQFAYYRYINKNGGGRASIAFLFVISILNAARNSLSFFLLLIVSMGLSVVTHSLGGVMNKVRVLTAMHFIFGVVYAVGTVQVELDNASILTVLLLIFPLSITLTIFLMWIILSLNGTILHLQARKQRYKLQMFQRLWRILVIGVIAVAGFFVVSSMSLSNRSNENYAPESWKYRWILLDGSLATIYFCSFAAIAWLWRPTRDNLQFSMSQELAQDEDDADAEDYDLEALENGRGHGFSFGHQALSQHDRENEDEDERVNLVKSGPGKREVGEENVVFAMGDDSDEEEGEDRGYKDSHEDGRSSPNEGKDQGKQD